jgi:glycosyltransferase involved in cell wall biosynthesis
MNPNPELVIVMPIYNEQDNIKTVISEWAQELRRLGIGFEMLALNDGSKDNTSKVLEELKAAYPEVTPVNKPNSGHGRTCRLGYETALQRGAQWILQIDSDGQCDPSYFSLFWSKREQADCVFGFRATRGDGLVRKLISRTCGVLSTLVSGVNVRDANVPYRMLRGTALAQALPKVPADFDVQNIALTVALKRCAGLQWQYIPIHFRDRQGGTNSINIQKIAKMGWTMLRELRKVKR